MRLLQIEAQLLEGQPLQVYRPYMIAATLCVPLFGDGRTQPKSFE
jgi:GAF domain-containing protein